jgi:beta-N-acetylhexosaminidase
MIRVRARHLPLLLIMLLILCSACGPADPGQPPTTATASATTSRHPTSPTATATSSPVPPLSESDLAWGIERNMTLEQKLGQMVIVEFYGATLNSDLQQMIQDNQVSGVLIENKNGNAQSRDQLIALNQAMQQQAHIPLFISTDFEGGYVNELRLITGERPSEAAIGATGNPYYAYDQGLSAAQTLKSLGLNVNFMPIVDVLTNPNNPGLPDRTFGSDPALVTSMGQAYLKGLTAGGVVGCLKHFPGLGAATVDPHLSLPYVNRSLDQLNKVDLVPYRTLIGEGLVPMVMVTHILNPQLDPKLPASLSPAVVTDLLRNRLNFNGVIISDTLWMGGISNTYPLARAAVLAVKAGEDLLLGPRGLAETRTMLTGLRQAVQKGDLLMSQIDDAVHRILQLKLHYGIINHARALQLLATPSDTRALHSPLPGGNELDDPADPRRNLQPS